MAKKKSTLGRMSGVLGAAVRKQAAQSHIDAPIGGAPAQTRGKGNSSKADRNMANARGNRKSIGRKPAV